MNLSVKENENFVLTEYTDGKVYWQQIDKTGTEELRKKYKVENPLGFFKTTMGISCEDTQAYESIPEETSFGTKL